MKYIYTFLLCCLLGQAYAAKPIHQYIRINTADGEIIIMLYNSTPKHRDNMVKLAKSGFYNGTLFHRVIAGFMIQGGDPNSKAAKPEAELGEGDTGYTVDAEFRDSLFHKKGVLAAARDNNPAKASSGCQFYLVQGKIFSPAGLDSLENGRLKFKIPAYQREIYQTVGGTPHLDRNYTVYGEIITGIAVLDKIAACQTGPDNRPVSNQEMQVSLLKRRQARKLERTMKRSPEIKPIAFNV
ncbi:peptidylprolyl isomerase [Pedobacter antarcticus 4BY]|uniref:peptidylprolyl isomerase n=2 Tax=Pedobacter antarcticus TaxID=34086 RepID=A0A081PGC4_9SPHI|nr:peptidylprolyl isomerase [Pedobacter antarcticus]KEQ29747.1 peptidylprolyl isomerase [Pedobacter antarcticus 4BY]SFE69796.1 peptidyl-prolyl cis-trans isomerase B (cyclophilin B) [Pedobacter antarcticus]